MASITTRQTGTTGVGGVTRKNSPLTNTEIDQNFINLNDALSGSVQFTTLGVGTAGSGVTGEIRATNNITAFYTSDIKFKENVRDIDEPLEKVLAIGGKYFDWSDNYLLAHGGEDNYFLRKQDFGVIAQDVLKVFPVAVRTKSDGTLAVDYEKLCALSFAAIRQLEERIKVLESR